ncbi:PIN domain-containing protein [Spirosoma sp. HMF3257]|uniref:Ribonuclease VapC n=1 Tax=Spirosoma telluris TaxID=2183553 RepID=A0A327NS42_9BACT|nr:PIN domain-containing protein [Spirosoma telluris]RAI78067.1 PIN domain nuclease [Spirosoma telluris]
MGSIIVDTSVWIDCFRGIQDARTSLVAESLVGKDLICLTPTILQEVLQGIRDDGQFERVKRNLLACKLVHIAPEEAAIEAAKLYRLLRKKGVTVRKPNDCLIAYYAIFHDIPVLHNDIDFDQIALHTDLRVATL